MVHHEVQRRVLKQRGSIVPLGDARRFDVGDREGLSRAHLRIAGHVQGVGFRYATMLEAEVRKLRGWARNLPDGRVEIVAEGARPAVEELIAWCRLGPRHARVHDVEVAWESPRGEPRGFRVA